MNVHSQVTTLLKTRNTTAGFFPHWSALAGVATS